MTGKARSGAEVDQRLLHLAEDSFRIYALAFLNERTADAEEVAEALGVEPGAAVEGLEQMLEAGEIEVAGEVTRRGESVPRYRGAMRAIWSDEVWAALSREERSRLSAWVLHVIDSDIAEAFEAGSFDSRKDRHVSRTVLALDEQGWRDLTRIHADALEASLTVHAESAERLAESGEDGFSAMSTLLCIELPPREK